VQQQRDDRRTGRYGRILAWALLVPALLFVVGRLVLPFVFSHTYQDDCSFGPHSNSEYRMVLAEAANRLNHKWPKLSVYRKRHPFKEQYELFGMALIDRLNDMTEKTTEPYKILMTQHAVMRAHGAYAIGDFWGGVPRPSPINSSRLGAHYQIDVIRIGYIMTHLGTAWIPSSYYHPDDQTCTAACEINGNSGWAGGVSLPVLFDTNPREPAVRCPPLPTAQEASDYTARVTPRR
jgi:hypothetical protein